ncbi:MAG: GntR family transcriptional regulator [Luteimonas sp.]|nr:GntR family transcriptional regulator [Luteimonas sp.]
MAPDTLSALLDSNAHKLLRNDLPTPLYHQMFSLLRDRILNGEIPHGSRIPTEFDLADSFGVSRITAKRALDELAAEGLVERRRGKGTHVIHRTRPKPISSPLTGLLENLEVLAEHTRVQLLGFRRVPPPEPIRHLFDCGPREDLVHAVRLRLRGDTPFGYYTSWTRTSHPAFDEAGLSHTSRLKLFEVAGIQFKQVEQVLSAVNADAVSAMHLQVEPGNALLSLERHSFDGEGNLVDLLSVVYRPDQFTYRMKLDVDGG